MSSWQTLTQADRHAVISHYRRRFLLRAEALNRRCPLSAELRALCGSKTAVRIADLGCGPFPRVGTEAEGMDVTLVASDLFADEYRTMLADYGVVPVHPVERQDMEALTYEDATFDLVHCMNALDHSEHPQVALREMRRVCRPDGAIYLWHIPNQGVHQKYRRLHQWNLTAEGETCRIWNPTAAFTVDEILPGCVTRQDNGHIIVTWTPSP